MADRTPSAATTHGWIAPDGDGRIDLPKPGVYRWHPELGARFVSDGVATHPEDTCEECGGRNVVWFAPNDLWNRVMRGGDRGAPDIYGIVCPTCFILRAEAAGVEATGWLVQPEVIHA